MPKKEKIEVAITIPKMPREATAVIAIKTPEDMTNATKVLSVLNKTLDLLTEKKKLLTDPINKALKEIRSRYKAPEEILESKIEEIRGMMIQYQTKQIAIADKKEAKLAEKLADGSISIEKATDAMAKLPDVPTTTQTEEGSIKFKPIKCFEVLDISALPIEYHLANEVKIRASMGEGKELPGVRYFIEQRPYNSRG